MPNNATAQSVLEGFDRRWEELLDEISPAAAADPRFRLPLRVVYIGAGLALLSAGVASLDPAQARLLGDAWNGETLDLMRQYIFEYVLQRQKKGPIQ